MVELSVDKLQAEILLLRQRINGLEAALASHERDALRFQALFEQSNDAIFLLDMDSVHIACNHRAAEMLGYESPNDIIGRSFRDVVAVESHSDSETRLKQLLSGESFAPYERVFITKDGHRLSVEVNVEIIRDRDGKALYLQSIARDISERKQTERILRASEARYRQMFERNEAIKLLINPDTGVIVDANPAAVHFYEYDRDTLRQMKISEINILPADQVADEMKRAREQERNYFVFQHRLASGDIRDVEVTSCPIDGEGGVLLYSIVTDVTERNRALRLMQDSELRYRQLFEDVPVALWEEDFSGVKLIIDDLRAQGVTDFNAYFDDHPDVLRECARNVLILDVNRTGLEMFGADDKRDITGKHLFDVMDTVGYHAFQLELVDIISGEHTMQIETPISTASIANGYASLGWTIPPGSEQTWDRVLVSLTDITEVKETRDALQTSETRYKGLFENVPVALWEEDFSGAKAIIERLQARGITDFDTYFDEHPDVLTDCARNVRVLDVNRAALELFGVKNKADVVGTTLFDTLSDDGYPPFKDELVALINNEHSLRLETPVRTVDHEQGYASLGWSIAPGSEDTWDRLLVSITDITNVKLAQDALQESEIRYRQLFEDVPVAVWEEDFRGVKRIVERLKDEGVTDFAAYFATHPDVLQECARNVVIRDGNRVALDMFGTRDKKEVIGKTLYETMPSDGYDTFAKELVDMIHGTHTLNLETPILDIKGQIGYGNLNWTIAPGSEDTWQRVLISITDITLIKQAQDALQESETRYRGLFEHVPVALWEEDFSGVKTIIDDLTAQGVTDFDAYFDAHPHVLKACAQAVVIVDVNEAALRQYQTEDRDIVIGMRLLDSLPDEAMERFKYELVAMANHQQYIRLELPIGTSSGEVRFGRMEISIAPGSEDIWDRVLVSITDITDMKQTEDALRESEARYRLLAEHATDMISTHNPAGDYLYASPAAEVLLGYTPDELIGRSAYEFFHPEDLAAIQKSHSAIVETPDINTLAYRIRRKDGAYIWFETTSHTIRDKTNGEIQRILSISRDITERKEAEQALRESEALQRSVVTAMAEGIVVHGADGRILSCNTSAERILGVTEAQMTAREPIDERWHIIREDGNPYPGKSHPAIVTLNTGQPQHNVVMGVYKPDDSITWISINTEPLLLDDGRINGVVASFTDITELRQAETTLRENEARYRMLFDIAPVVLMVEDFSVVKKRLDQLYDDGVPNLREYLESNPDFVRDCAASVRVTEANARAAELYGVKDKHDLEMTLGEIFAEGNYQTFMSELVTLTAGDYDYQFETVLRRFDGEMREIWLRRVILPGAEDDWSKVLIMIIDITERKVREQHRIDIGIERERANMLRQFISGASHDIRTPLATMNTSLYLLRHGGDDPERRLRHIETLDIQIKSLNRIIDDMLSMSRLDDPGQLEFTSINTISAIQSVLGQYADDIQAKGHTVRFDPAPDLAPVRAAEPYFSRAIGSLVLNAIDYTPKGGTIDIRVREADKQVVIEVQDNGEGIPADSLSRIFDPFYRLDKARQTGRGHTGMGLTLARKIVDLHNGTIDVSSTVDAGSTFTVRLPTMPMLMR